MILVVGSGVAGLSAALAAVTAGADVELVLPGSLEPLSGGAGGNTALAQGGVAAAIGDADSVRDHLADTVAAGAGLVDVEAAGVLVGDGARRVHELIDAGWAVDRAADGRPALGREAAHGCSRVVHAGGDRTGAGLHSYLRAQVRAAAARGRLVLREHARVTALHRAAGVVVGAEVVGPDGARSSCAADAVVLATGGYASLFPRTSNDAGAVGSGVLLAARAGALVADLEFVQFHPTVLHIGDGTGRGDLVSEAVRGAGAVLRDGAGSRFMESAHPRAELAPRDVVSRTIHRVLRERGEATVWLDATGIEAEGGSGTLARRFPGISETLTRHGIDWRRESVPVSPAAHYAMGGVASDLDGRSSVPGLFVAGEVASTGVHGANRLASNSLLEGLVFGDRAGAAAAAWSREPGAGWSTRGAGFAAFSASALTVPLRRDPAGAQTPAGDAVVRGAIARGLGIERDATGLRAVLAACDAAVGDVAELASMVAHAAYERQESRGAHQRADFPAADTSAPGTDPQQPLAEPQQPAGGQQPGSRRTAFHFTRILPTPAPLTARSLAAC